MRKSSANSARGAEGARENGLATRTNQTVPPGKVSRRAKKKRKRNAALLKMQERRERANTVGMNPAKRIDPITSLSQTQDGTRRGAPLVPRNGAREVSGGLPGLGKRR